MLIVIATAQVSSKCNQMLDMFLCETVVSLFVIYTAVHQPGDLFFSNISSVHTVLLAPRFRVLMCFI